MKNVALITMDEDVREIEELCLSAGFRIVYEMIQRRRSPHSATFLGRGKMEDLKEILGERKVEAVVINGDIRPKQHYNLEKALEIECIDRIGVVLRIFTERASSSIAKLQVERAKLGYELPLIKEWVHIAKMGERPGFMGGGEYSTAAYQMMIRSRMRKIDGELEKLGKDRELRRDQRREKGFLLIGLTGYTNAGKSSLLNKLAGDEVLVEDKMFSTLTTTTRRMKGVKKDILITDTIGFVKNLPPFLIEAFKSTLEEIYTADLVLLVVDGSEKDRIIFDRISTSMSIITPDVNPERILIILNKQDLVNRAQDRLVLEILNEFLCKEVVPISTVTGEGMKDLLSIISGHFQYPVRIELRVPQSEDSLILVSWLHDNSDIEVIEYGEDIHLILRCQEKDVDHIENSVLSMGGASSIPTLLKEN